MGNKDGHDGNADENTQRCHRLPSSCDNAVDQENHSPVHPHRQPASEAPVRSVVRVIGIDEVLRHDCDEESGGIEPEESEQEAKPPRRREDCQRDSPSDGYFSPVHSSFLLRKSVLRIWRVSVNILRHSVRTSPVNFRCLPVVHEFPQSLDFG